MLHFTSIFVFLCKQTRLVVQTHFLSGSDLPPVPCGTAERAILPGIQISADKHDEANTTEHVPRTRLPSGMGNLGDRTLTYQASGTGVRNYIEPPPCIVAAQRASWVSC
jgi:hypothetical protein